MTHLPAPPASPEAIRLLLAALVNRLNRQPLELAERTLRARSDRRTP